MSNERVLGVVNCRLWPDTTLKKHMQLQFRPSLLWLLNPSGQSCTDCFTKACTNKSCRNCLEAC